MSTTSSDQPSPDKIIQDAIQILVKGVDAAQSRGAYNLEEAAVIANARRVFVKPAPAAAAATAAPAATESAPAETEQESS